MTHKIHHDEANTAANRAQWAQDEVTAMKRTPAPSLTPHEIKWASKHDWFRREGNGYVVVWNSVDNAPCYFADFAKLQVWAGY